MTLTGIEKAKGKEVFESTIRLLEKTGIADVIPPKNILIKPNLTTATGPREGITTDITIVDALLHFLTGLKCKRITIGEGSGGCSTQTAFKNNGYCDLARKYNVELLDFNSSEGIELDVPNNLSIKKLRIARVAHEADFRISVAKLKIHSIGVITGCLKNMMGCLNGKKWKLLVHSDVQRRIVDLNKVVKPHFGLIDGIVGNEIDECVSHPIPMNILIGGQDAVSVDAASAECMGVNWHEVPHLVLAEKEGLGTADISKIELLGEKIEDVRRTFKRDKRLWTYVRTRSEIVAGKIMDRFRI